MSSLLLSHQVVRLDSHHPPVTAILTLALNHRRKSVGDQIGQKITPDSQKTTYDKVAENVSGTADKVAGAVQPRKHPRKRNIGVARFTDICFPESEKSTTQKMSDSTRGNADSAQKDAKTWTQSAQDTASGLAQSASDTLNQAGKSGKTT